MATSSLEERADGQNAFASRLQPITCEREPISSSRNFERPSRRVIVPGSAEQKELVTFGLAGRPESSLLQITSDKHASSNIEEGLRIDPKLFSHQEAGTARSGDIESQHEAVNVEEYSTQKRSSPITVQRLAPDHQQSSPAKMSHVTSQQDSPIMKAATMQLPTHNSQVANLNSSFD